MAENYIDKIEVDGVERPIRDTSGSVRYDAAQSLSDAQKEQARGNINAAPGGFGLGQANMETLENCNNAILSGWYFTDDGTVNTPGSDGISGVLCVSRRFDKRIYQELHVINGGKYSLWSAARVSYGDDSAGLQWGPWEYVNPPMMLGVEYRTTERYLGKPVYVKVVDCGEITDGKEIDTGIPWALKVDVVSIQSYYSNPLPRVPFDTPSGSLNKYGAAFYVNAHIIKFVCGTAGAGGQARAIIRYTKTTD